MFSFIYTHNYLKMLKQEFSRASSHGLKWDNKPTQLKRSILVIWKLNINENLIVAEEWFITGLKLITKLSEIYRSPVYVRPWEEIRGGAPTPFPGSGWYSRLTDVWKIAENIIDIWDYMILIRSLLLGWCDQWCINLFSSVIGTKVLNKYSFSKIYW